MLQIEDMMYYNIGPKQLDALPPLVVTECNRIMCEGRNSDWAYCDMVNTILRYLQPYRFIMFDARLAVMFPNLGKKKK